MKVKLYDFWTHEGDHLLYIVSRQFGQVYSLLTSSYPCWVRFENKDRVIAILRLNGFEVEDRT